MGEEDVRSFENPFMEERVPTDFQILKQNSRKITDEEHIILEALPIEEEVRDCFYSHW